MTTRWRITGTFTTTAPLHVGSGAVVTNPLLINRKNESHCDVQAVTKDYRGKPCVPGTALKGVLRAWADRFYPKHPAIDRVFGSKEVGSDNAESGRAEFHAAFVVPPTPASSADFAAHVPYWNPAALTGIASNVGIDRVTGAAARGKLFFHEFVPEGVAFAVEVTAARLEADEVAFLCAVLEHGATHAAFPYQFGASGADGWGRMTWTRTAVERWTAASRTPTRAALPPLPTPTAATPHVAFDLALTFRGPFLVNDASKAKPSNPAADATNFTPLLHANGSVWLPASSFRGALRSRAEFLYRSLTQADDLDPVERLFGHTGQASRLTVAEFTEVGTCKKPRQDFVAIDRFTGGAADGAKFDATYADRPKFSTRLTLALDMLQPGDLALLAAALRDVCAGNVPLGFGGSKGYGVAEGALDAAGAAWSATALKDLSPAAAVATPVPKSAALPPAPAPASLKVGVLIWEGVGTKRRRSIRVASQKLPQQVPANQLAADLLQSKDESLPVEFELEKGQPVRVRRAGSAWATSGPATAGRFANPYYFLRLADRTGFAGDLADAEPATHDCYLPGRYSGTIRVRLTAETPLLICAPLSREEAQKEHKTYDVLKDADKPLLASSSVRGMLRAAYEAVTNSRFGVFPFKPDEEDLLRRGNSRRYGYRMNAGEGLSLVPVRIEVGAARLMMGTNPEYPTYDTYLKRWLVPGGLLHAAWSQRYRADSKMPSPDAVRLGGQPPNHGDEGWCWLEKIQHFRWNKDKRQWVGDFAFWAVREAKPSEAELTPSPPLPIPSSDKYRPTGETRRSHGYFFVSNQNIKNKHDERFFFTTPEVAAPLLPIGVSAAARYRDLVRDYQGIHQAELETRRSKGQRPDQYLGGEPGKTAWSLHVYDQGATTLRDGTLCYAAVTNGGIEALYPVMISRRLYDRSPLELLPDSIRPATDRTKLSPADRVFGWVSQDQRTVEAGGTAHRSLVRVGPTVCTSDDAVRDFDPPVPLAILGQPKPAQGRFYLGRADGSAQLPGGTKEDRGYRSGNRIRGPKVFPHHRHFDATGGERKSPDTANQKSSQNRSIKGWVNPKATFEFDLAVLNLSATELGGLVWLLTLPAGHFLRLGLGKPLGFGSVAAEVVSADVADGAAWTDAIPSGGPPTATPDLKPFAAEFETAMTAANPKLLATFRTSAAGFADLPIKYPPAQSEHYTRTGTEEGGKHYQWFGVNELVSKEKVGQKLALPDLDDPALPDNPVEIRR